MKKLFILCLVVSLIIAGVLPAAAELFKKLDKPPLGEVWYGIYVDNDRVGFYRQKISEVPEGYRLEGEGSVRMKVMGFSKDSATKEVYVVGRNLALKSLEVDTTINGIQTHLTGKAGDGILRIKKEQQNKISDSQLKFKGDIFPGPAINLYPMMRDISPGKNYKFLTFDPEEIKVKEVKVNIIGVEKSPVDKTSLRIRNNLYPFVSNDIWMDGKGNSIYESVRDGLVITRAEDPKEMAPYIGNLAMAKKDLIYDFSLLRVDRPIKDSTKVKGLAVAITGWNDELPLLQGGGQVVEKSGEGRITIRTGSLVPAQPVQQVPAAQPAPAKGDQHAAQPVQPPQPVQNGGKPAVPAQPSQSAPAAALPGIQPAPQAQPTPQVAQAPKPEIPPAVYLEPGEKIESDAPEIVAKAKELSAGKTAVDEIAKILASWTADWLKDTIEDGGSAKTSFASKTGNCQTHARLYTALARAAGIPTRFVSGLVYFEGKGFLYHSWAESWLGNNWIAVDPTYNQLPADPTHLKFFEGQNPSDLAPIVTIIGKIRISILEAKY